MAKVETRISMWLDSNSNWRFLWANWLRLHFYSMDHFLRFRGLFQSKLGPYIHSMKPMHQKSYEQSPWKYIQLLHYLQNDMNILLTCGFWIILVSLPAFILTAESIGLHIIIGHDSKQIVANISGERKKTLNSIASLNQHCFQQLIKCMILWLRNYCNMTISFRDRLTSRIFVSFSFNARFLSWKRLNNSILSK